MIELSLEKVSKTYTPGLFKKKVRAVQNLSFEVKKGEVFGLVGPNGAGKSSTIRLLLGLTRPDTGTILFRGAPLKGGAIHREAGYLPENPYLYDHLTLRELLDFCGKASGMSSTDIARRADLLLEQTAMTGAAGRPLRTFSKGMLQRAGICFALLHDPSIVILDEPMSGLDPIGRKQVFDIVMDLKGQGKTIFFCSHILSDVERLCDRIGVIVGGRLVREFGKGDFQENPDRPVHLLVGSVSEDRKKELASLPADLQSGPEGFLLSLAPSDLPGVSQWLRENGIDVRGTRSERISLEELFLQTVKEGTA